MPIVRCPGQDKRFWRSEDVFEAPCPHCGESIEFWKDEPRRKCGHCGKVAPNPKLDLGCAEWCKFAKDCLGVQIVPGSNVTVRGMLIEEMKRVFGDDEKRISHALEVLDYAEQILAKVGGDPLVVTAAAILHDIGIHEAERKHGSAAAEHQEVEGPPIARAILQKLGVDSDRIEHICDIIGFHHSAGGADTLEFRILWDADRLANSPEECAGKSPAELQTAINWMYRTDAGRALAAQKLPGQNAATPSENPPRG